MADNAVSRSCVRARASALTRPSRRQQSEAAASPARHTEGAHTPAKRDLTLPNGMKVTLVPFGTVPKVTIYCAVQTGHIDEGSNEVALSESAR